MYSVVNSFEPEYHLEIFEGDIGDRPKEVGHAMETIILDTTCFGEKEPDREWYHYLLAQTVEEGHHYYISTRWLELLVSGFMVLYPAGITDEPYTEFLADIFRPSVRSLCMLRRANPVLFVWMKPDISPISAPRCSFA